MVISREEIATLVVFIISIVFVIQRVDLPLPARFQFFGRKSLPISLTTAPIAAILILWAAQCIDAGVIRDGIVGTAGVKPYNILILFFSLAYMSITLDVTGILQAAAYWVSNRGGNDGWKLFFYFYVMLTLISVVIGNDPVILSGTAFLVYYTRAVDELKPFPWLISEFAAANTASMVLFLGNPTNVVICEGFGVKNAAFSAYTIFPFLACSVGGFIALAIQFRSAKHLPRKITATQLDPRSVLLDPVSACFGSILLGSCLVVILVVSFFNPSIDVWMIILPFAVVKFIYDLAWDNYRFIKGWPMLGRGQLDPEDIVPAENPQPPTASSEVPMSQDSHQRHVTLISQGVIVNDAPIPQPDPTPETNKDHFPEHDSSTGQTPTPTSTMPLQARVGQRFPILYKKIEHFPNFFKLKVLSRRPFASAALSEVPKPLMSQVPYQRQLTIRSSSVTPPNDASHPPADHIHEMGEHSLPEHVSTKQTSSPTTTLSPQRRRKLFPNFDKQVKQRFPTFFKALPRLPFALVPFAFSQFILIEALTHQGWIDVFAKWLIHATQLRIYPTIWVVGVLGVILCNLSGTNIGATILLTKVVRAANMPSHSLRAAAIALAVASNIGAVSFTFSASLAGLLWKSILDQKKIPCKQSQFAKWNLLPLTAMTAVGLSVVSAEMAVLYGGTAS